VRVHSVAAFRRVADRIASRGVDREPRERRPFDPAVSRVSLASLCVFGISRSVVSTASSVAHRDAMAWSYLTGGADAAASASQKQRTTMDASATDIERMKAELALKDEQIKHEQARVLALELQIKLRERDERIERLERELKESAEKAPRSTSRETPQSRARAFPSTARPQNCESGGMKRTRHARDYDSTSSDDEDDEDADDSDGDGDDATRSSPKRAARAPQWTTAEEKFVVKELTNVGDRGVAAHCRIRDFRERLRAVSGNERTEAAIAVKWHHELKRVRREYGKEYGKWFPYPEEEEERKRTYLKEANTPSTPSTPSMPSTPHWSKEEEDFFMKHLKKSGYQVSEGTGIFKYLTEDFLERLAEVNGGYRRTQKSAYRKFVNVTFEKYKKKLQATETARQENGARTKKREKKLIESRPTVTNADGQITAHGHIKLQKTTTAKTGPNGEIILVPIPGVKFCHRCKRTNREGMDFHEHNFSLCIKCLDRVKELEEARIAAGLPRRGKGSSPRKKPKETKLPPIGADGKRDLLAYENKQKWSEMIKPVVDGDVQVCADVREKLIKDKQLYRNVVAWDKSIFSTAAFSSKNPIRIISWALANGASRDEINEDALKCAVERKPHDTNEPTDGSAYVPAVKVLKHLHKSGFPANEDVMHTACAFGDVDCVRYLKENYECCDFENTWHSFKRSDGEDNDIMIVAAQEGHVDVLKYLYENDCDFSVQDAEHAMRVATNRKPRRADGFEKVKEWIESTAEWRESQSEKEIEE